MGDYLLTSVCPIKKVTLWEDGGSETDEGVTKDKVLLELKIKQGTLVLKPVRYLQSNASLLTHLKVRHPGVRLRLAIVPLAYSPLPRSPDAVLPSLPGSQRS